MSEVIIREHLIKTNEDQIYSRLFLPKGDGPFPAVIIGHGYNGSYLDWTKECRFFAENGYVACAYDFRGGSSRSKSSGKTTDMTMVTEREDVCRVFESIASLPEVRKEKVFLMGGSMGGFASALAAERILDKAAGMILYFPAFCIPENWRDFYPVDEKIPETIDFWDMTIGRQYVLGAKKLRTFEEIGHFENPVLLLHGTEDEVVPISYSKQAKEVYPQAELIPLPGEGHGFSPAGVESAMKRVLDFMNHIVSPSKAD